MAIRPPWLTPQSGSYLLSKDKLDALGVNEGNEAVAVLANGAADLPHSGKLCTLGLLHVKDVGIAKAQQSAGVLLGDVLLGFLVPLALETDDGRENPNPLLAFLHLPSKLVPCVQASNAGCGGSLPRNLQDVAEAVVVESAHRVEVGGKRVGVPCLQLLDKALDVGGDDVFRRLPLLPLFRGLVDGG